jgi:hypothetical protein
MKRVLAAAGLVGVLFLVLSGPARAADDLPLLTAKGKVEKVDTKGDETTVSVVPTGGKVIVLRVTGTTKFSALSSRETGDKLVVVQRQIEAPDLKANQVIAITYTTIKEKTKDKTREVNVLLSAVVQP